MTPEVQHVRSSEVLAAAGGYVGEERAEPSGVLSASQGQGRELRLVYMPGLPPVSRVKARLWIQVARRSTRVPGPPRSPTSFVERLPRDNTRITQLSVMHTEPLSTTILVHGPS